MKNPAEAAEAMWFAYVVFWAVVGGMFGAIIFSYKKQPTFIGFLVGLLLGPVFVWFCLLLAQRGIKTCPYCAERIQQSAKVCRYCHKDLVLYDRIGLQKPTNEGSRTSKPLTSIEFEAAIPPSVEFLCWNCGKQVDDVQEITCPSCGESLLGRS